MDTYRFKQIVSSFLDSRDHLDTDRGEIALQIGPELIAARLVNQNGTLWVAENNERVLAEHWIIDRLAMIPMLADRILASIPENKEFVVPQADFLDDINRAHQDEPVPEPDAVATVSQFLSRRPGGTCSTLYLTSDAGEGKTTLINHLARLQAERYKRRETDWLLVPVALGGRPFLRFDDVIVASLVNTLRFQRLYFEAFLHLVRMGVLVPALDGFEEIFVETPEAEAISTLGSFIRQLEGEGSILIAARKAYFEFRSLRSQARLLDALPHVDVVFGRVGLKRWSRTEFEACGELVGFEDPSILYESVKNVVNEDHPLLTRPILVRRLFDLALGVGLSFLDSLRPYAHSYFSWLVDEILKREATEKWIDKLGDPPRPLLSLEEHHELLSYIAEETWISKTSVLSGEMMDSLAEIFCESKHKSPVVTRQVRERIRQHALIVSANSTGREFQFDHDDFREFFLGEQLANYMRSEAEHEIRKIFRIDVLPPVALDSAANRLASNCVDSAPLIETILKVGLSEGSSTYVRENAGAFVTPLLRCPHAPGLRLSGLVFPMDALRGVTISKVTFVDCYFRPTHLAGTVLADCRFEGCEFEHLGIAAAKPEIRNSVLIATKIHSLTIERDEGLTDYYDPDHIDLYASQMGFTLGAKQMPLAPQRQPDIDEDLRITEKALQTFFRSTYVQEGTFKLRLSNKANRFLEVILPKLLRAGILELAPKTRSRFYRTSVPIANISKALSECKGSFELFLKLASSRR